MIIKLFIYLFLLAMATFIFGDVSLKRGHKCSAVYLDNVDSSDEKLEICPNEQFFIPTSLGSGYGKCQDYDDCFLKKKLLMNNYVKNLEKHLKDDFVTDDKQKTYCIIEQLLSKIANSCKTIFQVPSNLFLPKSYNCTIFNRYINDPLAKCSNGLFHSTSNADFSGICEYSIKQCCNSINFDNYFKSEPAKVDLQTMSEIYYKDSKLFSPPIVCSDYTNAILTTAATTTTTTIASPTNDDTIYLAIPINPPQASNAISEKVSRQVNGIAEANPDPNEELIRVPDGVNSEVSEKALIIARNVHGNAEATKFSINPDSDDDKLIYAGNFKDFPQNDKDSNAPKQSISFQPAALH